MGSSGTAIRTSFSLSSLLCEEDQSCLSLYDPGDETLCHHCVDESDHEFIEELIDREANNLLQNDKKPNQFLVSIEERLSINARSDAVEWILNNRTFFGFHKKTAYLSVIYLDRFLSKRSISGFKEFLDRGKSWTVRLLSVACLSLAAKMEEYRAPAISEYNRVCAEEYNFQRGVVQRMELLVLKTLEWRMNLITPFDYFCHFINKIYGESEAKGLTLRAIELTLATLKDVKFSGHPSSVIAAASVLAAYDYQLTSKLLEPKIDVMSSSWGTPHKECILSCYNVMRKVLVESKFRAPNLKGNMLYLPLNLSTSESETSDCIELSRVVSSAVGHKRKLVNNETEQRRGKIR